MVNFGGELLRAELAKSTLVTSTLEPSGIVSDLLRSVQMLKRKWGTESFYLPSPSLGLRPPGLTTQMHMGQMPEGGAQSLDQNTREIHKGGPP